MAIHPNKDPCLQVLGGAGLAIAALPLTMLRVGGSAVTASIACTFYIDCKPYYCNLTCRCWAARGRPIAAVPLTAIWVGGSVVTVATSLATAQLGPVAATQRVGYVALASLSQARRLPQIDVPCLSCAVAPCHVLCGVRE